MSRFFMNLRILCAPKRIVCMLALFVLIMFGAKVCAAINVVESSRWQAPNVLGATFVMQKHDIGYLSHSRIQKGLGQIRKEHRGIEGAFASSFSGGAARRFYGSSNGQQKVGYIGICLRTDLSTIEKWQPNGMQSSDHEMSIIYEQAQGLKKRKAEGKELLDT